MGFGDDVSTLMIPPSIHRFWWLPSQHFLCFNLNTSILIMFGALIDTLLYFVAKGSKYVDNVLALIHRLGLVIEIIIGLERLSWDYVHVKYCN